MASFQRYRKQRVEVNDADWTPIAAPMIADYAAWRCDTSDVHVRTDKDDLSTEDLLRNGVQDTLISGNATLIKELAGAPRFKVNDVVIYVKSVTANATLIVTWVL